MIYGTNFCILIPILHTTGAIPFTRTNYTSGSWKLDTSLGLQKYFCILYFFIKYTKNDANVFGNCGNENFPTRFTKAELATRGLSRKIRGGISKNNV